MTVATDRALLDEGALGGGRALVRLSRVMAGRRRGLLLTAATATGSLVAGITASVCAAWLTGAVVTGRPPGELTGVVVLLVVATLARGGLAWLESWVAHDLAYRVMLDLRLEVFDGLERLAPAWLLGRRSGDVAAAALSDVEALEWFYAHTAVQVAVAVVTPVGAVGVLAVVDPRLALAVLPFALALGLVPLLSWRWADRHGRQVRRALGAVHAETADAVAGLREIVLLDARTAYERRLGAVADRLRRVQRAAASRAGLENALTEGLLAGTLAAVVAVGAALVADGGLDRSVYPVAVVLSGLALAPVTVVTGGLRNLGLLRATASRVLAVVDTPARVTDRPDAGSGPAADTVAVRFEDVGFGYQPAAPVLRGVTFDVPAGTTVALVGASGAGKSTCANLLLRFWDVDAGRVLVGGVDVRDVTQAALRRMVAMVPQDPYLFHGSIRDNIAMVRPDASPDRVEDAARRARVSEFTDDLPDGLDTEVAERGASLSGGQRQRVALARALLRDAPVLVLDEAVSNLDAAGAAALQVALDDARRDRTTLVIAHRVSTIAAADLVVVLDGGRVVAAGRHRRLLETDEGYRRLLATQVGPDLA